MTEAHHPQHRSPDNSQYGEATQQPGDYTLPPPLLYEQPPEQNYPHPPSPEDEKEFDELLHHAVVIGDGRYHMPQHLLKSQKELDQVSRNFDPQNRRQVAAVELATQRHKKNEKLQSQIWLGTDEEPGHAVQLAEKLRAKLAAHPSLALRAAEKLESLREQASVARHGKLVEVEEDGKKKKEMKGGVAEAQKKHDKARTTIQETHAALFRQEVSRSYDDKRPKPEGATVHDEPHPNDYPYGRPKGDGWNRLPSGRIKYTTVNKFTPEPVRNYLNQRTPRQHRDALRDYHEKVANPIAGRESLHSNAVLMAAHHEKSLDAEVRSMKIDEFRAQTLEEILAMAGNANYTPPATEQQLVGEWSDPNVYSDYMTSRLTEGLDEYLADANGKVSDQNRTAMHSTLSQLHNYLATIDESLTADGHSWTEFQKVAKLRGRVNKAYLGGRYRYEQLLRATGQGDALYTENGGLQLQDGSEVTLHSDGSYEYFDELRNRNVRRDAEGNEWRTPQASTDTAPAPEESPEDADAETMYDNYLSALEWWQRDQTPESAVKAAGLAARFAEKYAEAENDPVARQHGNKAAYWEHYLKTVAQRNLSADTRLLPRGEVVIQRATFYGQQGTWGIGANGTKSLLTTDANNEFVVVEEYNSAGYRVR